MDKVYAVDFDGTLCRDYFPAIGEPNLLLIQWLREERAAGCKIILWTCREGRMLDEAVAFCKKYGLGFDAVNENIPEMIQDFSKESRKIFAHYYIDDRAIGFNWPRFSWQLSWMKWKHDRKALHRLRIKQKHEYNQMCEMLDYSIKNEHYNKF